MQRSLLLSLGLLFALFGCDDSGHPTLDTGLPSDHPVGNLSADDSEQVCQGAVNLVNDLAGAERQAQIHCVVSGIITEVTGGGECAPARDNCLENGWSPAVELDLPCEIAPAVPFTACDATIGELEACVNDISAGVDTVLDAISCNLVDDPDVLHDLAAQLDGALDPETHEACANLAAGCLEFLDLPSIDIDIDVSIED